MKRRFNVGDIVRVRSDLEVGKIYHSYDGQSDVFTYRMRKNRGKEGEVIEVGRVGYRLDIDPIHTYTEEMLEPADYMSGYIYGVDITSDSDEDDFEDDATLILDNSRLEFLRNKIDEALSDKMFEKNPEEFKKLVDEYKYLYDKIN